MPDSGSVKSLIENYKTHVRNGGLSDEVYKWKLLGQFRGRPSVDATDFGAELLSIDYSNLIFHTPKRVIRFIAEKNPEPYRAAFRRLFDENISLSDRIPQFQQQVLAAYRQVEPKFPTQHDERTIATLLTYHDPDRYTFYKDSYYRKYCALLGVKTAGAGAKYLHYLELTKELVANFIEPDVELKDLLARGIPNDAFRDGNHLILAQDILYQCLDKSSGNVPDAEPYGPRYWLFAPGEGAKKWGEFYEDGVAALGWNELGDLMQYDSREAIAENLREAQPDDSSKRNDSLANFEFAKVMKPGDIIIAKRGRRDYLGYGVVASEYYFDDTRTDFKSLRKVDWRKRGEWHADFPLAIKTLTDITKYPEYVDELKKLLGIGQSEDGTSRYWVFQANPKKYDLEAGLRKGEVDRWAVLAHRDRIQVGDKVILWQTGQNAGCYALAEVNRSLFERNDPVFGQWAVGLMVTDNAVEHPIMFETVKETAGLGDLKVGMQGTNFTATRDQYEILERLIRRETVATSANTEMAQNVILYGPPGTGKTYNSIDRAVAIADGIQKASHIENKKRFDELRRDGRVEFITFHQNYAYEDFMVGIRPDVDNEQLRFQPQKGIFYRLAKRARDNYEQSQIGKGRRSFDEVLTELLEPLERGEEIPIRMASGISFKITEVSEKSLSFTKQSGGKDHTLSISTLRDVVEGVRDVPGGLDSYYKPLVKLIQEKRETTQPADRILDFVLIIDEINRANISRVFGELITLLEADKRLGAENELRITLPNGEKDFAIPPNLHIVGTMNTADKSIALVDVALRRRFEFVGFYPKPEDVPDAPAGELLASINARIFEKKKSADYLIGHAYFMTGETVEDVLRKKVIPLLSEYFSAKPEIISDIFDGTPWSVTYNTSTFDWDITEA